MCPDVEKISNFRADVNNLHFSVRTLNFVLKRSVIGPIMHKNAMKHENIGFRRGFRRRMLWGKLRKLCASPPIYGVLQSKNYLETEQPRHFSTYLYVLMVKMHLGVLLNFFGEVNNPRVRIQFFPQISKKLPFFGAFDAKRVVTK